MKPRIAIDFDGVIHDMKKIEINSISGGLIPGAKDSLKRLLYGSEFDPYILTARQDTQAVSGWLYQHTGEHFEVTNTKHHAEVYVDDHGYHFDGDWQKAMRYIFNQRKQ